MFLDKRTDLTDHQGTKPCVDILSQAGLQCGETLLLQSGGDPPRPGLVGPLEQGRSAPECQRLAVPPSLDEVLEPDASTEPRGTSAGNLRDRRDPLDSELPAQVPHVAVNQVGSRLGWCVGPQRVGDLVGLTG